MPVQKQTTPPRFQVDRIYFKLSLLKAYIPIKFKCRFFVQLKTYPTSSNLKSLARSKDHYRATHSQIQFDKDEIHQFDSYLVYDNEIDRYKKKQIQIIVNLISDNRSDQVKLVGRIRVDLNEFMIDNQGKTLIKEQILENCSVSKPDVAKLQYQLQLVMEQKMNIQSAPDKESVFGQIEKSLFADALEYNEFSKQVFGKDAPPSYSQSKLNKSLNQGKLSRSISQSSVQKPITKLIPVPLPKEKFNLPLKQNSDKPQPQPKSKSKSKTKSEKEPELIKEKKPLIPGVSSLKKPITKKQQTPAEKIQQTPAEKMQLTVAMQPQTPIQSFKIQRQQQTPTLSATRIPLSHNPHIQTPYHQPPQSLSHRAIQIQSPSNQPVQTQSPCHRPAQSPSKAASRQNRQSPSKRKQGLSSKLILNQTQSLTPEQQQGYVGNPLTQSMFEQQQVIIQSLQQQLQQANQIIEQYRLQMDLIKEEADRLQHQKGVHVAQIQLSRTRGQQTERATKENAGLHQQLQASVEEIQRLKTQIEEYSKVFQQKEEIISEKDKVIEGLESTIGLVTIEYQGKLAQQDQLYNGMHQKYLQASQQESYLKTINEELNVKLVQKDEERTNLERMIKDLQHQVVSLNSNVKSSNLTNLSDQLAERDRKIRELENMLEVQRNSHVQLDLRVQDMQKTVQTNKKQMDNMRAASNKQEEMSRKLTEQKQKMQQQMQKAVEKSKQLQKDKYLLAQQITSLNLQERSLDKLVQQKVVSYKSQLHQLTLSYEQSQNKISQLKFAVQSYQSALKEQQKKHRDQVEQLTKKLQTFNTKEHLLRQSLDMLEKQTTQIRTFVQDKENKLKEFQELVIFKDEEIEQKNDKLGYLQRKQRMADNTIEQLKMQLKMTEAMYSESYEDHSYGKTQGESSSRLAILNEANMQLLEKQKMQSQRLNQKDRLIHQLQKSLTTIEPLKRQIYSLQNKISELQNKNNQLREQIKNLTKINTQQQSKQIQQTSQLQHVYRQCETFQQQIKSLEEDKIILCSQQQEKELEMLHLQSEEEYSRETVKKLQKKLEEKQAKLLETARLLKRSEDIEDQLNQRISKLSKKTEENEKREVDLNENKIPQIIYHIKETRSKQEEEIYRLTEQLQTYKQREESYMCNVLDLQQQLEKVKKEKLSLSSSLQEQKTTLKKNQNIQGMTHFDKKDLKIACDQLERLIEQRIKNRETESLIQVILSNSQGFAGSESRTSNEEGHLLSRQKNTLQQKSRILSRQVQKIKSVIFKKTQLSYKDKTEMIQLLKPCENITNELIKAVQDFAKENDQQVFSEA